WIPCRVQDALGREVSARFGWLAKSATAVMEMSAAAGLTQLLPDEREPIRASTFGVGQMLSAAAARGARHIILGLGGSATNDGGTGMARALGFRFLAGDGHALGRSVTDLRDLARIESPNDLKLPSITAACDVTNPLLGPTGATRTFGAQKGATSAELEILEGSLTQLAEISAQTFPCDHRTVSGAGAAGGLGFGLLTFAGAEIRSGFEVVAETIDLRSRIARADIVITGEGRLDHQTLSGKVPAGVARLARELRKPVFVIAGQATADPEVRALFAGLTTLDDRSPGFRETPALLEMRAAALGPQLRAAAGK
ncbi:MAG TPA: glycerate kinase, partial [Chthoniobacterales bacterium]